MFRTLKQIFQLESIPCVYLQDFLNRLLPKVCLDASFTCLSPFLASCVTFNDLCCRTQLCGLLSRIHLRTTNQSWHTRPNESVLHFQDVFVVSWHQNWKLVWVIFWTVSLFFSKYTNFYIISYIQSIEPNRPIGKHTLRVFTWYFEQINGKNLYRCFIYVFISVSCILSHFWWFMLLNAVLWLTVTHTFKGNRPKLAHWSKWICITLRSCFCC